MKTLVLILAQLAYLTVVSPLYSQPSVTNGSVNGSPTGNDAISDNSAQGWTTYNSTPDLCDISFRSWAGSSLVSCIPSPDGGTWLGLASNVEAAQTTITGLIPGERYKLSFYGANFGDSAFLNGILATPMISVVDVDSITVSIPLAADTWNEYSFNFIATAATHILRCTNPRKSDADTTYASLDGFKVEIIISVDPSRCEGVACLGSRIVVLGNPLVNQDYARVKFTYENTSTMLKVIDMQGRVLSTYEVPTTPNEWNTHQVPLQGLTPGIYFLRMGNGMAAKMVLQ